MAFKIQETDINKDGLQEVPKPKIGSDIPESNKNPGESNLARNESDTDIPVTKKESNGQKTDKNSGAAARLTKAQKMMKDLVKINKRFGDGRIVL